MLRAFGAFCIFALSLGLETLGAATVTTNPVGVYSIACPGDSDTFISVPVHRDAAFVGKVQSVNLSDGAATLIVDGEPGFGEGQFVYGVNGNRDRFYVKFSGGELEGAWYNVEANGAFSLQIEIGSAEAGLIAAGDGFLLIPHWTLNTLMPEGRGISASTSKTISMRSKVMFYDCGRAGINQGFSNSYYYYKTTSENGWGDSLLSGTEKFGKDDSVICPDAFFILRNDNVEAGTVFEFSGSVPMTRGSIVLCNLSDSASQDNFVAIPSCTPVKLSHLTHCIKDDFFKPSVRPNISAGGDYLYVYSNGDGKNKLPLHTYHFNASNWYKQGGVLANDEIITANSAVVIRRTSRSAQVAQRAFFTPEYVTSNN